MCNTIVIISILKGQIVYFITNFISYFFKSLDAGSHFLKTKHGQMEKV